jgi:hypothetical protein
MGTVSCMQVKLQGLIGFRLEALGSTAQDV